MMVAGVAVVSAAALLVAACARAQATDSSHPAAGSTPASRPAPGPHVDGDHFSVDASLVGPCAANAECTVAIKLTVRDDFHVNAEYPHKFTATDAPGVEYLGKDAAKKQVFSKPAGDFAQTDPKSGVLTVRFKAQPGPHVIGGTLKIGVCSDQNCMLPQVELAVPVTVS